MIQNVERFVLIVMAFSIILGMIAGCGSKEEKAKTAKPVMASGTAEMTAPDASVPTAKPATPEKKANDSEIAVEVDGVKMTKTQLNTEMTDKLAKLQGQIPDDKLEQAKADIRKGLIEGFVNRTLLSREIAAKKVTATEKEIAEVIERLKSKLPPGVTMDEFVKKNHIDTQKMHDEIAWNIQSKKLIEKEMAGTSIKITDKEIADFYEKNKDKFQQPEIVHARHILVEKSPEDTKKKLADKKAKADDLRKKLLGGADFAELAAKNSDCPTKQYGGDIGTFTRGQMVKPFEDAAFSQKKNVIGPVVETEYGFHIIQVLDHQASQVAKLDNDTKQKINDMLVNQKRQNAFERLLKRLKANANIVFYGT